MAPRFVEVPTPLDDGANAFMLWFESLKLRVEHAFNGINTTNARSLSFTYVDISCQHDTTIIIILTGVILAILRWVLVFKRARHIFEKCGHGFKSD